MRKAKKVKAVYYTTYESPVGPLLLAGEPNALHRVSFESSKRSTPPGADWKLDKKPFAEVIRQLQAYFRGELKEFDLPLAMEGTEFQLRVWNALRAIPYGEKRAGHSKREAEIPFLPSPAADRTLSIRLG